MLVVNFKKNDELHTVVGVTSIEEFHFHGWYHPVAKKVLKDGIVLHTRVGRDFFIEECNVDSVSIQNEPDDIGWLMSDDSRYIHDLTGEYDMTPEELEAYLSDEEYC